MVQALAKAEQVQAQDIYICQEQINMIFFYE